MIIDPSDYEIEDVPYVSGPLELHRLALNIGGVYCIMGKYGNARYVGESICIRSRIIGHLTQAVSPIRKEKSTVPLYEWLENNIMSVRFKILESNYSTKWDMNEMISKDNRVELEQKYIRKFIFEGANLYNCCTFTKRYIKEYELALK